MQFQDYLFNLSGFSEISPVIVKDGIMFCSDRRLSGVTDRTSFDDRRLYSIYIAEKKDTADWRKPNPVKSERIFPVQHRAALYLPLTGRQFISQVKLKPVSLQEAGSSGTIAVSSQLSSTVCSYFQSNLLNITAFNTTWVSLQ